MIKKTMTITSLAILIAAISVATTMTMVQANVAGDEVNIAVSPSATLPDVDSIVGAGAEYVGVIGENAELTFTDTGDGVLSLAEVLVTNEGTNVPNGDFTFTGDGNPALVAFTDDVNGDKKVQFSELSLTFEGDAAVTQVTASITADANDISVDIANDGSETVWIEIPDGPGTLDDIAVTIDGMDWVDGPGAIGAVECGTSDGAITTALFDENTLQFTMTPVGTVDDEISVHCVFEAFHGDLEKTLLEPCKSEGLEVKRSESQECTFNVTYDGARATIIDTLPAEWNATTVAFTNDDDTCSVDEDAVTKNKGKNKKGNGKSATGITCEDVGESADFDVTVTTRESPGKGHAKKGVQVFKPTSCPTIDVNSGAKAILLDDLTGVPVLGTLDGLPIVLDETGPLPVDVVDNDTQGISCAEA